MLRHLIVACLLLTNMAPTHAKIRLYTTGGAGLNFTSITNRVVLSDIKIAAIKDNYRSISGSPTLVPNISNLS